MSTSHHRIIMICCLASYVWRLPPAGSCYEIEGYILPFEVESQNPFGFYCMAKNSSFYIQNRNTSGSGTAIRITCQAGQIGPQSVDITLAPGNSAYYTVNGDCEIHSCE